MAYRGGVKPDVIPEVGERELEEWCRRFVEDPAQVKSFGEDPIQTVSTLSNWVTNRVQHST